MEPARFPAPASPPPEQLIGAGVVVGGGERSNEKPLYTPRGTLRRDASVKISSSNHVETGASGGREQLCYVSPPTIICASGMKPNLMKNL
jgi:hypothetical protein